MVIFNKNIFDEETNMLIWRKNKFYPIIRSSGYQTIIVNEIGGELEYGIDTDCENTFCEFVDCNGEVNLECLKCNHCHENNGVIRCMVKKFKKVGLGDEN